MPRGTFVELGAYNGVTNSNTYLLEMCFGWHGPRPHMSHSHSVHLSTWWSVHYLSVG